MKLNSKLYAFLLIQFRSFKRNFQAFNKCFFSFTQPYTWIVIFFIWFICSFRITQLSLQVSFILFVIIQNTFPESPLQIGIDIHFNGTITNCFTDLVLW